MECLAESVGCCGVQEDASCDHVCIVCAGGEKPLGSSMPSFLSLRSETTLGSILDLTNPTQPDGCLLHSYPAPRAGVLLGTQRKCLLPPSQRAR